MSGKRGCGRPGEEGFSPASPLFFPPSLPLGFLGSSARAPAGGRRAAQGARRGAPRVGGAGQAGAGPRAGRCEGAGRSRAGREPGRGPGRRAGGQGPRAGYESDSRFPSPGSREAPWKKLKCRGLVGPAGGVLRLAGPRGPHLTSSTWVRARRAAQCRPRGPGFPSPPGLGAAGKLLQSSQAALGCG